MRYHPKRPLCGPDSRLWSWFHRIILSFSSVRSLVLSRWWVESKLEGDPLQKWTNRIPILFIKDEWRLSWGGCLDAQCKSMKIADSPIIEITVAPLGWPQLRGSNSRSAPNVDSLVTNHLSFLQTRLMLLERRDGMRNGFLSIFITLAMMI